MRKLKLSLEHLAVETFAAQAPRADTRGTVHAREESHYETWEGYSCVYAETCQHWDTCYQDCSMDCTFRPKCV